MQQGEDQISRFIKRLPVDGNTAVDPDEPLAVFESALKLDREQEQELTTWLLAKYKNLRSDLGHDQCAGAEGGGAWFGNNGKDAVSTSKTFFGKRQLYEMVYRNEVDWRRTMRGGIYEQHNLVIPSSRRVVQQQIARANNYFFGSDPWVTTYPVGSEDKVFSQNVDRWIKDKFVRSGTKDAHSSANEGAFIRGEAVLKTVYKKELDYHDTIGSVLMGPEGEPMVAADGDYIFEDDNWTENQDGKQVLSRDLKTEAPDYLFVKDPATGIPVPNEAAFQTRSVTRALTKKDSSETKEIYYMDFLCPLNAPSIEEADCCVHLYREEAIDIATMLMERAQNGDPKKLPKILETLNAMASGGNSEGMAQGPEPRPEEGEDESNDTDSSISATDPRVNLGEFYCHYDPYGDGRGRRSLVVLMDLDNDTPIYYDYVANVTPEGFRPLHATRINPVKGRWHGSGNMESYWPLQEMIDLLANRWNHSQSASARVDFWNPHAVVEGDNDPNLKFNGGKVYTLKQGFEAEQALQSVFLTDIKSDKLYEQIQFLQQHMMNMSGVSNANDSRSAGLDTAQLATGINNIAESGQELFSPWIGHLMPGHKSAIDNAIKLEVEHMDSEETFHFFEKEVRKMGRISRSELRYLDYDIRIELTRFRTEKELVQNEKAYAAFHRFYALPMELQELWASQARRTLYNLEIMDAEDLIQTGYYTLGMVGLPPDPASDSVGSGMGSQKPGLGG